MTFEQWWEREGGSHRHIAAKTVWDAALAEPGTRELYEALRRLRQDMPYMNDKTIDLCREIWAQVDAAIAKYEGSVEGVMP